MGSTFASDLASGELSLEQAIGIHLQSNHYPPVPLTMVPACIEAIELCNLGEYDSEVPLPDGVTFRGRDTAPAGRIAEGHHLQAWLWDGDE